MQFDVVVIADLCVDILMKGDVVPAWGQAEKFVDDCCVELGGSAGIFASQFARLGGTVGLYGKVGNDLFGHFLRDRITGLQEGASDWIPKPFQVDELLFRVRRAIVGAGAGA